MKKILFAAFTGISLSGFCQKSCQLINNSDSISLSVITMEKANELFTEFDKSPLFDMKDCNNCEDRANAIATIMAKKGYIVAKFWLFGEGKISLSDKVYLLKSQECGTWGYHVAIGLLVSNNGKNDTVIIDPAIKSSAVFLKDWTLPLIQDNRKGYLVVKDPKYYTYPVLNDKFQADQKWTDTDDDLWKTSCGLCGHKPKKCSKSRFRDAIIKKREELNAVK